jgi:hypothetical protein
MDELTAVSSPWATENVRQVLENVSTARRELEQESSVAKIPTGPSFWMSVHGVFPEFQEANTNLVMSKQPSKHIKLTPFPPESNLLLQSFEWSIAANEETKFRAKLAKKAFDVVNIRVECDGMLCDSRYEFVCIFPHTHSS